MQTKIWGNSFLKIVLLLFMLVGFFPAGLFGQETTKVMVIIEEKVAGIFGTTAWEKMGEAEAIMMEKFLAAGFNVVDHERIKTNITRDEMLVILSGDTRASAVAGIRCGAQYIVVGKAMSKNAGGNILNTNMQSLQATIQARVIRADDARILAAHSEQAAQAHIDEIKGGVLAIKSASSRLADSLIQDIKKSNDPARTKGQNQINVVITGLVSYRHLIAIKGFLEKSLAGVKAVHQQSYTAGTAQLVIDYAGKSSQIADTIANAKFNGFRIEPENVTPSQLDLRAVLNKRYKK